MLGGVGRLMRALRNAYIGRPARRQQMIDQHAGIAYRRGTIDIDLRDRLDRPPVVDDVVGGTERRVIEARGRAEQYHRIIVDTDIVPDLLEAAVHCEIRNRIGEWAEAEIGEPGADANQVLLGDTDIEKPLGIFLFELLDQVDAHIGGKKEDILVLGHALEQRVDDLPAHAQALPAAVMSAAFASA